MNFKSIGGKINISVIGISLLSLAISFFILFYFLDKTQTNTYVQIKEDLQVLAKVKIAAKSTIGLTNAISIANDRRIEKALITNNREPAIESLKNISQKMKKNTEFNNIKVHLHTYDNKSFLRNWEIDKYGDDLSDFRASIVSVNKFGKPVVTFEVGQAGLSLRAVTCVRDINNTQLGSIEFMQGLNSVAKSFEKSKSSFLLLMDESVKINPIAEDKKFKSYGISQKFINKDFLNDAQNINIENLTKNGYTVGNKYFYTYIDIKDFQDKKLGIALLGKPLYLVNTAIDDAKYLIYIALIIIAMMTFIIIGASSVLIKKLVTNPLKILKIGLDDFFLFLQNKTDNTQKIELNSDDEFGAMAKSLNENISVSAKLHEEIHELNINLEARIAEKTAKVTTLLDNAGQGFLTFNDKFIIDEEYSKECINLLGKNLENQNITDILFKESKKKDIFQTSLLSAMNEKKPIIQKSYISLLPSMIILNKRAIKLEYKILDNSKIMLILTNITAQKKLEKKMKKEQEIMKMIIAIVSEPEIFYETKKEYVKFIDSYVQQIDVSKTPLHNTSNIYRTIHTFKGSFSQLYIQDIVLFLHDLESEISKLTKEISHTNEELIGLLQKSDFNDSLEKSLNIIEEVLGGEFLESDNYLKIEYSDIIQLQEKIEYMLNNSVHTSSECEDILSHIQNLSSQKLYNLLTPYIALTQQLAQRLEKEIYTLELIGDENIIVQERYKPFIKSLIHVFRNSVDHGIESPEIRVENDKDEMGTITCSFTQDDKNLYISISDDGAGLNIDKIKEKLAKNGITTDGLSNDEIFHYIFDDNFSTKESVSDISGRGVGMSAVKAELDMLEGKININSVQNKGTIFEFVIPTL